MSTDKSEKIAKHLIDVMTQHDIEQLKKKSVVNTVADG